MAFNSHAAMVDRITAVIVELEKDKSLYPKDWVIPGRNSRLQPLSISPGQPAAGPNGISLGSEPMVKILIRRFCGI